LTRKGEALDEVNLASQRRVSQITAVVVPPPLSALHARGR